MKTEFERNEAFVEVTNDSMRDIALDPNTAITILDIRPLEYYKIQQGVLQQKLSGTILLKL